VSVALGRVQADEKDVGPGNLGGLGYAGRGLAMRTYEMLVRGARGVDGVRYSVLQRRPGEAWPRILEVMVRRRVENLEKKIEQAEARLAEIEDELSDPAAWSTPEKSEKATRRHDRAKEKVASLYAEWEEADQVARETAEAATA
ncbi:MAG TPA: ABC transporter C-terminal domain-containing protein, partial [Solirubrobacterales bacterium]|nr:ABC transporter C-terminal domain-containing protein [Solirubrobacterales bacterium]